MSSRHGFLVGIETKESRGSEQIRFQIEKLRKYFEFVSVSSIYRRYHDDSPSKKEPASDLICVVHLATQQDLVSCVDEIKSSELRIKLLCFDDLVQLDPNLPLPHPQLVEDTGVLRCGAECWGPYIHPILGQSLNDMARSVHSFKNVEFFAQGLSVVS